MKKINIIITILFITTFFNSCNKKDEEIKYKGILTANSEYNESKIATLLDNDPNTFWNSGQSGTNWVNIKFEDNYTIKKINFVVSVAPPSNVGYDILVLENSSSEFKNVNSNTVFCKGNDELNFEKELKDIREIKIVLKNDSSWMSVKSLSIIGNKNLF